MLSERAQAQLALNNQELIEALETPSYEELVYLTAYWALMDWSPPTQHEPVPLSHARELFELQKPANKARSVFNDRAGLGLPAQRKVRFNQKARLTATPSDAFLASRAS